MAKVCPLFSSSSGNATYIGDSSGGILIDAGQNAKQIRLALNEIGVSENTIQAVFVTHEHSDHISGLRVFCSQNHIPVYASPGTYQSLQEKNILTDKFFSYIFEGKISIGTMEITAFHTSHDSSESYGFSVETADERKISLLTDTGIVTKASKEAVRGSDLVLLESNHEIRMLENGPYPYPLKQRILSDTGHLSNIACGEFAKELVQTGTTRLILSHLSKENNHPDLAYETTRSALEDIGAECGKDFVLKVASPRTDGRVIVL